MMRSGPGRPRHLLLSIGLAYFVLLAVSLLWFHLSPQLLLALTLAIVTVFFMTLRPTLGVHAMFILLCFENAIPTEGGLTGMKVIGAVVLVSWLLSMAIGGRAGIGLNAMTLALLLFLGWTGVSLAFAFHPEPATTRMLTFVQLALIAWMFNSVIDRPAVMQKVLWTFVLSTLTATVLAIGMYAVGTTVYAVGFVGNRNLLSAYINAAIITAYLLYQMSRSAAGRVALLATLPVLFTGLALTFSRTGVLALSVALLLIWYRVARDKRFFVLAASVAMLAVIVVLLPTAYWSRVSTILPAIERREGTFGQRVELWEVGMRMIEDRPLVGVGPGNFVTVVPRYARGKMYAKRLDAHNTYISVAAQMGLPALALFLLLFALGLREAHRAVRVGRWHGDKELEMCGVLVEVNLVVMMVSDLSGSAETMKLLWILFGLALSVGQQALRLEGRQPAPAAAVVPRGLPDALAVPPPR